jgi:uncharacterized protein YrrD
MQENINRMIGYAIRTADGDLGKVDEFYFDDQTWTIRYVVAETGNWLSGRKVLIIGEYGLKGIANSSAGFQRSQMRHCGRSGAYR